MTVADVGRELGVEPSSLYRVVRWLEQRQLVVKQDRELHPGDGATTTT